MKQSIKNILDEIGTAKGAKAKEKVLKSYEDVDILKYVLYYALSNRMTYYISKAPSVENISSDKSLDDAMEVLLYMKKRQITGDAAKRELGEVMKHLSSDDKNVVERIASKKLGCGIGATSVNKIFPDLIEVEPYQGCQSFSPKKAQKLFEKGEMVFSQIKNDGRYLNLKIHDGIIEGTTRQGERNYFDPLLTLFTDQFHQIAKSGHEMVFCGELVIDGLARTTSNGIISALVSIGDKICNGEDVSKDIEDFNKDRVMSYTQSLKEIKYIVWDLITYEDFLKKESTIPYKERLNSLKVILELDT